MGNGGGGGGMVAAWTKIGHPERATKRSLPANIVTSFIPAL